MSAKLKQGSDSINLVLSFFNSFSSYWFIETISYNFSSSNYFLWFSKNSFSFYSL